MFPERIARLALPLLLAVVAGCGAERPDPDLLCHAGAYRLATGERLAVTPSDAETLRYRFVDGRSGRLYPDGEGRFVSGLGWAVREPTILVAEFGACGADLVRWSFVGEPSVEARRIGLRVGDRTFRGRDVELAGRLVLPADDLRALVVLVHGSEDFAATDYYGLQYLLPPVGIGVFVFDKRGTGRSGGEYTQDFDVLANDVAAAVREVRDLVVRDVPVGLIGGSQGAWVAPLAATREPVDFLIAAYGMVESPLAEDRAEVLDGLARRGYGEDVLARAREVTDATGRVMASGFRDGYDELARVKARNRDEPWMSELGGEFTQDLVDYPVWALRIAGPWFDRGTPWDYDPLPALESLGIPMLWILAGGDTEAPTAETLRILRELQPRDGQLDVVVFPGAEHGVIEVVVEGGERRLMGHAAGYWALQEHWILNRNLEGRFGRAELFPDPGPGPAADPQT